MMRRMLALLSRTPLHPQWLVLRGERERLEQAAALAQGHCLDIGCADRKLESLVPAGCDYLGIDYPDTAIDRYRTTPDVFADARSLPFPDGHFQTVFLLEVLEHVPHPEAALDECTRVLAAGGRLILSMPFLYPEHDAPFDFQRYTLHGLRDRLTRRGYTLDTVEPLGHPLATAALLMNIALARTILDGFERRGLAVLLTGPAALLVPLSNLAGGLADRLGRPGSFMPHGHRIVARRGVAR